MDVKLLQLINSLAGKSAVLDTLFIYLTNYGAFLFVLILLMLWFSKNNKVGMRQAVMFALTTTFLALLVNQFIEFIYFRERPFVVESVAQLIDKSSESTSFPSNHSAGAFAIAFTLFWRRWKYGGALLVLAFLLALSRVYVGVHYPLDIVTGALVAFLMFLFVRWQQERLTRLYQFILTRFQKVEDKILGRS